MTRETLLRKPVCSRKTWLIAAIVTAIALLGALAMTAENSYAGTYEGTVSFNMTDDGKPVTSDTTGKAMMMMEVDLQEIADTDLSDWDLEQYSYTDYDTGEPDPEAPTLLKLYLYLLNNHYVDAGDGEALRASGEVHSFFMNHFWGHDCNLLYYVNGTYPLFKAGWGATADGIILNEGDRVDLAMFTDWGFYTDSEAGFNFFADADSNPEDGAIVNSYEATAGVPLSVQVIRGMGNVNVGEDTSYQAAGNLTIHVSEPNGAIDPDHESDMTLEAGCIDLTFDEPGEYYIWVDGGIGTGGTPVQSGTAAKVTVSAAPAPHTHDWGTPEYVWSEDKGKVKATRVCSTDASHVEEEEVETTSSIIKDPSTTAEGIKEYVASFENTAFETQTARESIPKLDPDEAKTIVVKVLTQKDENKLFKAFPELTVRADAAETYGFAEPERVREGDRKSLANEVTSLDVLIEASHQIYGDEFTKDTAKEYVDVNNAGTMTKIFGESTTMAGFTVNGENPTYEDGSTGSLIDDSIIEDGDSLRFFRTFEDDWGSGGLFTSMLFFDGEDQTSYDVDGDELEINVSAAYAFDKMMGGSGGPLDAEGAVVAMKDSRGEVIATATVDEDGKALFTDLQEGNYTLVISEYDGNMMDEHFVTPYATLNVLKVADPVKGSVVVAARNFAEPSEFDVIPQEVEVSSDAAESFGNFGDIIYGDNNGKITLADVLYTIHKNKYGEGFTAETAENYIVIGSDGWNQKLFGEDANFSTTAINEDLNMTGSSYNTTVEDGDQVDIWAFLDTVGWSDPLTRFDKKEYNVRAGEEFQVHIAGIGWSGPVDLAKVEGENFTAATYNEEGKLTPIDGAVMDSDGKIKLTFAEEGEYSISASGKVATSGWDGSPVTADAVIPWAKVRVISAEGSQQVEEELTAADDAVQTGAAAAEEAQKIQTTADASRKAAEEAMKTPGQKAVDAAKKAQKDAEEAAKAANEAKAAADAAVEAAKKAVDEAVTDAEKDAAADILNNAEKLAEEAEANKKTADEALLKANAMVKSAEKAAAIAKVKKVKKVIVNVKTVNKKAVDKAVKKAGGSNKYVTTIVLGKKVKKIKKNTFKTYKKVKTIEVRTKKLTKKSVKGSLNGSSVKTIKVKVGSKKTNKKYVKKYKKIFTKKNAGKKVKVRR